MFLNNQQDWRNKKGNKKISRKKWQWKHNNSKARGWSKRSSKREVYSNTILPQETRKTSDSPTLHLKQLENEEQKTLKISRRKKIIKIWAEINEKNGKKQ